LTLTQAATKVCRTTVTCSGMRVTCFFKAMKRGVAVSGQCNTMVVSRITR
jgi:hypothetical protein